MIAILKGNDQEMTLDSLVEDFQSGNSEALNDILIRAKQEHGYLITYRKRSLPRFVDEGILERGFLLGVQEAAEKWDPKIGPFDRFLRRHINHQMIDELRAEYGRNHNPFLIKSLEDPLPNDDNSHDESIYRDLLVDESIDHRTLSEEKETGLLVAQRLFTGLSPVEKRIVYLRYGHGKDLDEIKDQLGLSPSRVSQILTSIGCRLQSRSKCLEFQPNLRSLPELISLAFESDPLNTFSSLNLPGEVAELRDAYLEFLNLRKEKRVYNPIKGISSATRPLVRSILYDISASRTKSPYRELAERGFRYRLLGKRNYTLTELAETVAPELTHRLKNTEKWKKGNTSIKIALRAIQSGLYLIPGYEEAEKCHDEEEMAGSINEFLKRDVPLKEFFESPGFGISGLMQDFVDPERRYGIKTKNSPKAVLDFYFSNRFPNLLDRSKDSYIEMWRVQENNRWNRGEESTRTGLEAVQDYLRSFKGYRKAEDCGMGDELVRIVNEKIKDRTICASHMYKFGLNPIMTGLVDPLGIHGFRKKNSPRATLEFYFKRTNPALLDRSRKNYLQLLRIYENGQWQKGEESVDLALDLIQDFLRSLEEFKDAENRRDREKELDVLDRELISKYNRLSQYMASPETGLGGLMNSLYDPNGINGLTRKSSAEALLRFYDHHKRKSWFDKRSKSYIGVNKNGSLYVVYAKQNPQRVPKDRREGYIQISV